MKRLLILGALMLAYACFNSAAGASAGGDSKGLGAILKKSGLDLKTLNITSAEVRGTKHSFSVAQVLVKSASRPVEQGDVKAIANAVRHAIERIGVNDLVQVDVTICGPWSRVGRFAAGVRSQEKQSLGGFKEKLIRTTVSDGYLRNKSTDSWYALGVSYRTVEFASNGRPVLKPWKSRAWWRPSGLVRKAGAASAGSSAQPIK